MTPRSPQSGSIFFYILIGIVLFAALGFALSRNFIKTDGISDQKAKLLATELIAQSNSVKAAVAQLRLRGIKRKEISFENPIMTSPYTNPNCTVDKCKIFKPDGGGLSFPIAPREALVMSDLYWEFTYGYAIEGVDGQDDAGNGNGMFMTMIGVNQKVCRYINNILYGFSLATDLTAPGGWGPPVNGLWNGTLTSTPAFIAASFFGSLGPKDTYCMRFPADTALYNGINSTQDSLLPGPSYGFVTNMSPGGK